MLISFGISPPCIPKAKGHHVNISLTSLIRRCRNTSERSSTMQTSRDAQLMAKRCRTRPSTSHLYGKIGSKKCPICPVSRRISVDFLLPRGQKSCCLSTNCPSTNDKVLMARVPMAGSECRGSQWPGSECRGSQWPRSECRGSQWPTSEWTSRNERQQWATILKY